MFGSCHPVRFVNCLSHVHQSFWKLVPRIQFRRLIQDLSHELLLLHGLDWNLFVLLAISKPSQANRTWLPFLQLELVALLLLFTQEPSCEAPALGLWHLFLFSSSLSPLSFPFLRSFFLSSSLPYCFEAPIGWVRICRWHIDTFAV